jgi:general secretion pathway protein G
MVQTRSKALGRRQAAGFTMIEIMLVLALVGLIMGAIVVGLRKRAIDGQIMVTRMQVQQLGAMVFQHRLANSGECPSTKQWVEDKTLKSEPKDAWGHLLVVVCPGEHEEGGADIVSVGPDGQAGTKDDIESWKLQ